MLFRKLHTTIIRSFGSKSKFTDRLHKEDFDPRRIVEDSKRKDWNRVATPKNSDSSFLSSQATTTEYPGHYPQTNKEESLHHVKEEQPRLESALDDYFRCSNKADYIARSEKLLEASRRGDYKQFLETTKREFEDTSNRFDFHRENFVSFESNNEAKISDELNSRQRVESLRDIEVVCRRTDSTGAYLFR